eukprot:gene6425-8843_t
MSLKELPSIYFKLASAEVIDRLNLCNSVSAYVEDVAEVDQTLGKQLSKIGSQAFSVTRSDFLSSYTQAWERVYIMATTFTGKQESNYYLNISQNICKPFPEYSKASKKRIKNLQSKILTQIEDLRRAKHSHNKNIERYHRLVEDTESAIRYRDAEVEVKPQISHNQKDEGFMNRSLTKMLAKLTPNEKKLQEKCRDMIKEVENSENQLRLSHQRLNSSYNDLLTELLKAMAEIDDVERSRHAISREGLARLLLAQEVLTDRKAELVRTLTAQIDAINVASEVAFLTEEVEKRGDSSTMSKSEFSFEGVDDVAPTNNNDNTNELIDIFAQVDKLADVLDYMKTLSSRALSFFHDVSEVEKQFYKSAIKGLEKHGYARDGIPVLGNSTSCADLLSGIESPTILTSWEGTARMFSYSADIHLKTAEAYTDVVGAQLQVLLRRVEANRKELMDKLSNNLRRVESAQANAAKVHGKLMKLQQLLKERRSTVRKAKEDSSGSAGILDENHESMDITSKDDEELVVNNQEIDNGGKKKSSVILKQGLENIGTTFRQTKLSMVVGLETPTDRIVRIENKIQSLEEEEKDMIEEHKSSIAISQNYNANAKSELIIAYNNCKAMTNADLASMKSILESFCQWQLKLLEQSQHNNGKLRSAIDAVSLEKDLAHFVNNLKSSMQLANNDNSDIASFILEIPSIDEFSPIRSELIEEERKNQGFPPSTATTSPTKTNLNHLQPQDEDDNLVEADELNNSSILSSNVNPNNPKSRQSSLDASNDTDNLPSFSPNSFPTDNNNTNTAENNEIIPDIEEKKPNNVLSSPSRALTESSSPTDEMKGNVIAPHYIIEGKNEGSLSINKQGLSSSSMGGKEESNIVTELSKFGLTANDKILESYSCALYPKKGLLTHGRMFITQHFMAFAGWPDTRVLLSLSSIESIEKTNTLFYIPNAILVKTGENEEFFFGSFIDRDQCFNLLNSMTEVEKRLIEINGKPENIRQLEFGYQSRDYSYVLLQKLASASSNASQQFSLALDENKNGSLLKPVATAPISNIIDSDGDIIRQEDRQIFSSATTTPFSPPINSNNKLVGKQQYNQATDDDEEEIDTLNITSLFANCNLTLLHQGTLDHKPLDVWKSCWLYGSGYGDFLHNEGDLKIQYNEWSRLKSTVMEDIANLPFSYTRNVSYSHPRTTMLMFGPKNAPATQTQYLYLPCDKNIEERNLESLETLRPRHGVILTITQFDGIPMADVFKVLQYWTFEPSALFSDKSTIRVGLHVHFTKASMFKSQIAGGTKEELTDQVKKWFIFNDDRIREHLTTINDEEDRQSRSSFSVHGINNGEGLDNSTRRRSSFSSRAGQKSQHPARRSMHGHSSNDNLSDLSNHANLVGTSSLNGAPAAAPESSNMNLYLIGFLIVILLIQWASNQSLSNQIKLLNSRLELNQKATDKNVKDMHDAIKALVDNIGKIKQ